MQYSVSVIMPVGWVIALLLFVVLIALGLKILTGKKTSGADYLVRGAILTPAEISFLAVLETINYPGA